MLDVYELCTPELQEKMVSIRSKFKDMEDRKLEQQQQKVRFLTHTLKPHQTLVLMMSHQLTDTVAHFCLTDQ